MCLCARSGNAHTHVNFFKKREPDDALGLKERLVRATKKPGFQLLLPPPPPPLLLLLQPSIVVDAINIDGQVQYIIIIRSKKSLFFEKPIVFYDNNNNTPR